MDAKGTNGFYPSDWEDEALGAASWQIRAEPQLIPNPELVELRNRVRLLERDVRQLMVIIKKVQEDSWHNMNAAVANEKTERQKETRAIHQMVIRHCKPEPYTHILPILHKQDKKKSTS